MNKQDVFELTNEHRNTIYIKTLSGCVSPVNLSQWGAGEYKIDYDILESFGRFIILYIPFATTTTLEKAIVFTRFAQKQGVNIVTTYVGYMAYGRQERETNNEPMLISITNSMIRDLVNPNIIDVHSLNCVPTGCKDTWFSPYVNKKYTNQLFVIAPDKGAVIRNDKLNIHTNIVIDKTRSNGNVVSRIVSDSLDYIHHDTKNPHNFVIYDDICDGGRTFVNVAKLVKEKYPDCNITLCVAHCIIPFGTEELKQHIDKIITLDTCIPSGNHDNNFITVLSALDILL